MMPFRLLSGQALIHSMLFASYTLAALSNVTIDDAIATASGAAVPQLQYSPQGSWNIGNTCTGCFVKPDPTLAYNATWHDITFSSGNGFTPTINFSYTGSSVYIFFILANNVPGATTNTNVDFLMDGTHVGTYNHIPSNTSDYEYNVPVYVNNSVTQGLHSLVIQPITNVGNVLILFDYLIYTMDTDSSSSVSLSVTSTSLLPSVVSTSAVLPSPMSSTHIQETGSNIGAIAGGTVGGVAAAALIAAFLLCYWKQKRRNGIQPSAEEGNVINPFIVTREVASTPFAATIPSSHPAESSFTNSTTRSKRSTPALTLQTSNPATTTAPSSSSGASSSNNAMLAEQVEQLRDEVARLRRLNDTDLRLDAPPEYSIR